MGSNALYKCDENNVLDYHAVKALYQMAGECSLPLVFADMDDAVMVYPLYMRSC